MKNIILFSALIICVLLLPACANNKILLSGPVGTEVYSSNNKKLGTIDNSGSIELKIKSRTPLLKAYIPGQEAPMPVAIDYKERNRNVSYTILDILGFGYVMPWTWFIIGDVCTYPGNQSIQLIREQKINDFEFESTTIEQ